MLQLVLRGNTLRCYRAGELINNSPQNGDIILDRNDILLINNNGNWMRLDADPGVAKAIVEFIKTGVLDMSGTAENKPAEKPQIDKRERIEEKLREFEMGLNNYSQYVVNKCIRNVQYSKETWDALSQSYQYGVHLEYELGSIWYWLNTSNGDSMIRAREVLEQYPQIKQVVQEKLAEYGKTLSV